MKGEAVIIYWIDSHGVTGEWEFKKGLDKMEPVAIVTIGFIEEINRRYITVYQSDGGNQVMGRMTIPRTCITKMRGVKFKLNQ